MGALGRTKTIQGTVAAALMWLYLYAGMGANAPSSAAPDGPFLRIFVSFGLIAFYVLTYLCPAVLGRRSLRLPTAIALMAVLGAGILLEAVQPDIFSGAPVSYLSFFFQGICLGFAYAQMGVFLFLLSGRAAAISLSAAMTAAALGNLLIGATVPLLANCLLKGALIVSIALFLRIPFSDEPRIRPKEMFAEYAETRPLFSELFFISILYGFMVMFASMAVFAGAANSLVLGVAYLVPTAALLLFATVFNKRIGFLSLRWIVVPAMTVVIVPLTIVPIADGFLFLAAVLALFQVLEASSALSLAESAREHGLPPISSFVLLRILGTVGILIGRCAYVALTASTSIDYDFAFKVAMAALTIVLVVWRTLVSYSGGAANTDQLIRPNGELRRPSAGNESTWQSERDDQLRAVAASHALSERETEVFLLLAKGRNAEYIGRELYVSENTVRSHIQRIYRKLDTHSQQELLDFVDQSAS